MTFSERSTVKSVASAIAKRATSDTVVRRAAASANWIM